MKTLAVRIAPVVALALFALAVGVRAGEEKIALDKLPKAVVDAVKAKYAGAELVAAVKEGDKDNVSYEVSIKHKGHNIDVTLKADGTITAVEKEITAKDLPKVVAGAVEAKYPKANWKKVEEITKGETLTYEVVLETADKKTIEVVIDPKGKILAPADGKESGKESDEEWTTEFHEQKTDLTHTGRNPFFILEAGHYLILEKGDERLVITVLDETKMIDGVETRVVLEKETKGGKLVEVARNYFAISKRTSSVYYFGEDVDIYKDGKVTGHGGSWLSGVKGAKYGLMMPGTPLLGAKYYQEIAPGDALDRAHIVSMKESIRTKSGVYQNCLRTNESSGLEAGSKETKLYAPGIGLVEDAGMRLVEHGFIKKAGN